MIHIEGSLSSRLDFLAVIILSGLTDHFVLSRKLSFALRKIHFIT